MISLGEIIAGLFGAWRLAHFDVGGMRWFDLSADGFYRSFFAAVIALPAYIALVALQGTDPSGAGINWTVKLAFYPVYWIASVLVLGLALRALGLSHGFAAAVIATNWGGALVTLLMVPISAVAQSGLLGPASDLVYLITYLASLAYVWFVLRTAIGTTSGIALALTAITELVSILIQQIATTLG